MSEARRTPSGRRPAASPKPRRLGGAGQAVRSVVAVVHLVAVRVRRRPGPSLLVAAGVAAATATLLGVLVLSTVARDASLERELRRLAPEDRAARASAERAVYQAGEYRGQDAHATGALRRVAVAGTPTRGLLVEGVRVRDGTVVQVVALQDPVAGVALRSGRLPRSCDRALRGDRRVGLHKRAGMRADGLSGGERQRLAIAKALAAQPAVLLADEPTANLDQANAQATADLLARLAQGGTTVISRPTTPS